MSKSLYALYKLTNNDSFNNVFSSNNSNTFFDILVNTNLSNDFIENRNCILNDNESFILQFDSMSMLQSFNYSLSKYIYLNEAARNYSFSFKAIEEEELTTENLNELLNSKLDYNFSYESEAGTLGLPITQTKIKKSPISKRENKVESNKCKNIILCCKVTSYDDNNYILKDSKIISKTQELINSLSNILREKKINAINKTGNTIVFEYNTESNFKVEELVNILTKIKKEGIAINAGLVVYKNSYPREQAYNIAKSCSLNAEKASRLSNYDNSFIDFHIIRGTDIADILSLRDRYYKINYIDSNKALNLTNNPYSYGDNSTFNKLNSLMKKFNDREDNKGELKALRDAILISKEKANEVIARINSKINNKENRLDDLSKDSTMYIDALELYELENLISEKERS